MFERLAARPRVDQGHQLVEAHFHVVQRFEVVVLGNRPAVRPHRRQLGLARVPDDQLTGPSSGLESAPKCCLVPTVVWGGLHRPPLQPEVAPRVRTGVHSDNYLSQIEFHAIEYPARSHARSSADRLVLDDR
jgi:hypothetical protein